MKNCLSETRKRKYKLKSKKKFFTFLLIIIIPIVLFVFTVNSFAQNTKVKTYETVTIYNGDTLWEIAKEYKEDREDIRYYIHKLIKLNDLEDCNIYVGQKVMLP